MSTPPEEYFGDMDLTEQQIDERLRYTDEMYDAILDSMYEIDTYKQFGEVDYKEIQRALDANMAAIIAGYVLLDDYLRQYIADYTELFIEVTQRHIDDEWYLSEDRALFGAENSANDALNYKDYKKAIADGYTHKQWHTELDNKVRDTHRMVEGKVIPIKDYFVVGDALMRFPKDEELAFDSPHELVNCRCTIKYLNEPKR